MPKNLSQHCTKLKKDQMFTDECMTTVDLTNNYTTFLTRQLFCTKSSVQMGQLIGNGVNNGERFRICPGLQPCS